MDDEVLGTTAEERDLARRAWAHLEVIHAVGIFGPDVHEDYRDIGLEDPLAGYLAGRIAPLGPVGAEVTTAIFHGFAPAMVARALPGAWERVTPDQLVDVTRDAAARVLARLADGLEDEIGRAAELAREAAGLQPMEGRPLGAARAGLPWPERPLDVLWEAATRIRETRGDGHVACLITRGLDGVEAHATVAGDTRQARGFLRDLRGWTEPEWDAAIGRLTDRGILDADGRLTTAGRALRADLERHTDALAVPPWRALGWEVTEQLLEAVHPLVWRILDAELLPLPIFRKRIVDPRGPESPAAHTDGVEPID